MLKIYLAGGMRTDWREKVKKAVPHAIYFDPTVHGLEDEVSYTQWDVAALAMADIVLGYLEEGNPSGLGLMFELGYATAAEKEVVFVNEWEGKNEDKYTGMARAAATAYYTTLDKAIRYIAVAAGTVLVNMRQNQLEYEAAEKEFEELYDLSDWLGVDEES